MNESLACLEWCDGK